MEDQESIHRVFQWGVLSVILFTFHNHLTVLLVTAELLLGCSVVAGRGWE